MNILENYSLKELNSFSISAKSRYFAVLDSIEAIQEFLNVEQYKGLPRLILGGGSNILLSGDYDGITLKVDVMGRELIQEDENYYYVKAGAGENWHHFVLHCIDNGYAGIENLSLIPGNLGAAPMQNIGAYGVELKDVFHKLEAVSVENSEQVTFHNSDCKFGYRNSIFKSEAKDQYIITSVTLRLAKESVYNTSYGALQEELDEMSPGTLSAKAISEAVCNIRNRKLPNPAEIHNAGSFFKNPIIPNEQFNQLQELYPEVVSFKNSEVDVKLAAAWLIDSCDWKGKRVGDAGVHENHALVLVNHGNANGSDILKLSLEITDSVKAKFGVELEREVNLI